MVLQIDYKKAVFMELDFPKKLSYDLKNGDVLAGDLSQCKTNATFLGA